MRKKKGHKWKEMTDSKKSNLSTHSCILRLLPLAPPLRKTALYCPYTTLIIIISAHSLQHIPTSTSCLKGQVSKYDNLYTSHTSQVQSVYLNYKHTLRTVDLAHSLLTCATEVPSISPYALSSIQWNLYKHCKNSLSVLIVSPCLHDLVPYAYKSHTYLRLPIMLLHLALYRIEQPPAYFTWSSNTPWHWYTLSTASNHFKLLAFIPKALDSTPVSPSLNLRHSPNYQYSESIHLHIAAHRTV